MPIPKRSRQKVRKQQCFLVRKALKSKGLKTYTKKKIPKRSIDGELKEIRRARKLVKLFNRENLCIIEDDETYCKKDFLVAQPSILLSVKRCLCQQQI